MNLFDLGFLVPALSQIQERQRAPSWVRLLRGYKALPIEQYSTWGADPFGKVDCVSCKRSVTPHLTKYGRSDSSGSIRAN
jgi:hypothetical protein